MVAVGLAGRIEPGVEVGGGLGCSEYPDRVGQQGVEARPNPRRRNRERGVEMGYLSLGVDAGVGPPGPDDGHPLPGSLPVEPSDRGFDPALDGVPVRLPLPAREIGPVVREVETDANRELHWRLCLVQRRNFERGMFVFMGRP